MYVGTITSNLSKLSLWCSPISEGMWWSDDFMCRGGCCRVKQIELDNRIHVTMGITSLKMQ